MFWVYSLCLWDRMRWWCGGDVVAVRRGVDVRGVRLVSGGRGWASLSSRAHLSETNLHSLSSSSSCTGTSCERSDIAANLQDVCVCVPVYVCQGRGSAQRGRAACTAFRWLECAFPGRVSFINSSSQGSFRGVVARSCVSGEGGWHPCEIQYERHAFGLPLSLFLLSIFSHSSFFFFCHFFFFFAKIARISSFFFVCKRIIPKNR